MRRLTPSSRLGLQRGATGLETAIILVAFIVVASVFAYVVLSAGIFTTKKSGETISAGIDQVTSSIEVSGDPKADAVLATVLSTADNPSSWTALPDVTASTVSGDRKEGTYSVELAIAPGFASGLVAYEDLVGTIDLSGHIAARSVATRTAVSVNTIAATERAAYSLTGCGNRKRVRRPDSPLSDSAFVVIFCLVLRD